MGTSALSHVVTVFGYALFSKAYAHGVILIASCWGVVLPVATAHRRKDQRNTSQNEMNDWNGRSSTRMRSKLDLLWAWWIHAALGSERDPGKNKGHCPMTMMNVLVTRARGEARATTHVKPTHACPDNINRVGEDLSRLTHCMLSLEVLRRKTEWWGRVRFLM